MKNNKKGTEDVPDFKELSDRVIANPSPEPFLVIKTNLDPDHPTEENPYFVKGQSDKEKFSAYFSDDQQ